MKKLFKKRILTNTGILFAAAFLFMIAGCEQAADIVQSVQNVTPVASDFTVTGLTATADGGSKAVSIKPKTGKSQGVITIYYEGINGSFYSKRVNAPSAAGKYAVTFDVAAADGFNAANGLKAGTLTINLNTAGGNESEDEDTDDDNNDETAEKTAEEETEEITGETDYGTDEKKIEPFILIDFEDDEWKGNSYGNRKVEWGEYEWLVNGIVTTNTGDHKDGKRSLRLRGTSSDKGDIASRIELIDYINRGIESISFDYASYSGNSNGTLILYYLKEDGEDWEEAGRIENIPKWIDGASKMLNAVFELNISGNVRFKIEKAAFKDGTSVNIDNIIITYLQ